MLINIVGIIVLQLDVATCFNFPRNLHIVSPFSMSSSWGCRGSPLPGCKGCPLAFPSIPKRRLRTSYVVKALLQRDYLPPPATSLYPQVPSLLASLIFLATPSYLDAL